MPPSAPLKRKLVIIGDGACGKTSLLTVFTLGHFPLHHIPTVFENFVSEVRIDKRLVDLSIWDTAGQEEYERLRLLSYSGTNVLLIAFSLDSTDSLENVEDKWIDEVNTQCYGCPVLLIGLKKDLRDDAIASGRSDWQKDFVTTEQGQALATRMGALRYLECSALRNEGVSKVFEHATRAALAGKTGRSRKNKSRNSRHSSSSKSPLTPNCCILM
ncbi:MAG: rho family GTPase Rho2 [Piptocephalis tieghemiana]|nr:MAG: rho family GTPase Rho2 [Piptocephalis tieghemiana]